MMDILDVNKNPPDGVRVLSNGAWQDKKTGQIVKAAPGAAWDSKKASEMAKKRWEAVKEKTRDGIVKAVEKKKPSDVVRDFPEAHEMVVETLMTDVVLNENEKGKTRVDSYSVLLGIEGSVKNKQADDALGAGGVTIHFSPDVAKHMMDRLIERQVNSGEVTIEIEDD